MIRVPEKGFCCVTRARFLVAELPDFATGDLEIVGKTRAAGGRRAATRGEFCRAPAKGARKIASHAFPAGTAHHKRRLRSPTAQRPTPIFSIVKELA
jgi:hypothetical protein